MSRIIVDVPARFYDDHASRDLPSGRVVKPLARRYRVELTLDEFHELLNDALYYASPFGPRDFDGWRGLVASARATVRVLEAVRYTP